MELKNFAYRIVYCLYRLLNTPLIIANKVHIGNNVHFRGRVFFKSVGVKGNIYIGDNVNINSSLAADPIGGDTKTILYTRYNGIIKIENGVGLSNTTIVAETSVVIGEYTNIGGGTKIYDTDFHSLNPDIRLNGDCEVKSRPVNIGKKVFIGGHVIILKGVSIGDGAVIGAGSVVVKNVPANEIWAGNPARFLRKVCR